MSVLVWEQEFNEVQELREELRVMQHLHEQVSGPAGWILIGNCVTFHVV